MKRKKHIRGIARQWMLNSFGIVLMVLLVVVVGSALMLREYYYGSARQVLLSRSDYVYRVMEGYADGSATGSFDSEMKSYVASYSDKNMIELMALDSNGVPRLTSSGFAYKSANASDFEEALSSSDGIGWWTGEMNGQKVMAVCRLVPVLNSRYSAFRFVVSLEMVDRTVLSLILMIGAAGAVVLFGVYLTGITFTQSLMRPIREIGAAARRIAGGDFKTRISRQANDELGELCAMVNSMADELETTERLKNDFISSVSHELRTPLTAIQGWAETLQDVGKSGEPTLEEQRLVQSGMRVILDETQRLSGMVEELLDFSRMQSGRLRMNMEKMDVLAELEEAVLIYEEKARRENILLRYNEPETIPVMVGDRTRLRQVFINVIDNALKYSDAGGEVRISASVRGDSVLISVSDDGIGIAPEDLERVKMRFYKGNYSRRGSGIGLAVADEIVTQHGGSLTLTSALGVGTTVQIMLPLGGAETANDAGQSENEQKIINIE